MSLAYALLLDGGFLRYKLSKPGIPTDAGAVNAFIAQISALPCLRGMRLHRIYFYDSKPLQTAETKPWRGGRVDFRATAVAARNQNLHASLMKERY